MANTLAVALGFLIIGLVLVAVLGAVERREKYAFVAGVALLLAGPVLTGGMAVSSAVGGIVALGGFLLVVASTVPLLGRQPTTS